MNQLRKFLLRVAYFLVLVYLLTCLLFVIPFDKEYGYNFIKKESSGCSCWLYNRMFRNAHPVDIVCLGSSRTKGAFNESLIEDSLTKHDITLSVANFGYYRLGRNMEYTLLNDLLKNKRPKYILLEVREEEDYFSHVDFKYIADPKDVLMPVLFFNIRIFKDMFYATTMRLEYFTKKLSGKLETIPADSNNHGYANSDHIEDRNELEKIKREKASQKDNASVFENWFNRRYPTQYLEKILALVHKNQCNIFFVYLPAFGGPRYPQQLDFYKQNGKVLLPPTTIFDDPSNWSDRDHFNSNGATKFSAWLANQLATEIK